VRHADQRFLGRPITPSPADMRQDILQGKTLDDMVQYFTFSVRTAAMAWRKREQENNRGDPIPRILRPTNKSSPTNES